MGLTRFDGLLVEFRTAVLIFSYDTNDNVWWCKSCILSWHRRNKILLLPNWKFYPGYHFWIQSGYLPKLESQLAHSTFTHVPYPVKETGKILESFYRKNSVSNRLFQSSIVNPKKLYDYFENKKTYLHIPYTAGDAMIDVKSVTEYQLMKNVALR